MLPENVNDSSKGKAISSSLLAQADNGTTHKEQKQLQVSKQQNNNPITLNTNGYNVGVGSSNKLFSGSVPRLLKNFPGNLPNFTKTRRFTTPTCRSANIATNLASANHDSYFPFSLHSHPRWRLPCVR